MSGTDRETGQVIGEDAHLAQSITDILTTPVGSRVMRRDYGSDLPRLIDRPINSATIVDLYHATADALVKWEPRFQLKRVQVDTAEAGFVQMSLEGQVDHRAIDLTVTVAAA